jgi:hypothetical protein
MCISGKVNQEGKRSIYKIEILNLRRYAPIKRTVDFKIDRRSLLGN